MSITVRIPTPMRKFVGDRETLTTDGGSLVECIEALEVSYPGIKERLCDDGGEIRRFVNIYVNGEDVRFMDGLQTSLQAGDEVSIVPAVAGGGMI